jgi:hypothetical protein
VGVDNWEIFNRCRWNAANLELTLSDEGSLGKLAVATDSCLKSFTSETTDMPQLAPACILTKCTVAHDATKNTQTDAHKRTTVLKANNCTLVPEEGAHVRNSPSLRRFRRVILPVAKTVAN